MISTYTYYVAVARASGKVTLKDLEYSLESLGGSRDGENPNTWIIHSVEPFGVLSQLIHARLGARYHWTITRRPRTQDTTFPFLVSPSKGKTRTRERSGTLLSAQWATFQDVFEDAMENREIAVTAESYEAGRDRALTQQRSA